MTAIAAMTALTLAACGDDAEPAGEQTGGPREHKTMNVLSLTGTTGERIAELYKPFEQEYNVTINWVGGASSENLAKLKATKANPEYDNAVLDDLSAYTASTEGLLAKIDPAVVTNLPDMFDAARTPNDDGVAWGVGVTGIFYNTEIFKQKGLAPPQAWEDLMKPELCEGLGMASLSGSSTLKATMMLGGMAKDGANTDAAVRAGLDKLKALGKCVDTFEASVGALDAKMQSKSVTHGIQPSTSILRAKDNGFPVEFVVPAPGSVGVFTTNVPIKNAPNPELSQLFVDWMLRPDVQVKIVEALYYSPLNKKVTLPAELTELGIPGSDVVENLYAPDLAAVSEKRSEWSAVFDREVAGK